MTVAEIYNHFKNPPNLRRHMLRVAKIGVFIAEHWNGESIDKNKLLHVLLLHDIGNIVKFDMEKYPQFLEEEEANKEYWVGVQKEIINKYGKDDHLATKKMLSELGVNQEIIKTVYEMSYWNTLVIEETNNWILKILLYADLRVSPKGVISLKDRLDDIHQRLEKYKNRNDLYESAKRIEQQIQENMTVAINNIDVSQNISDEDLLVKNITTVK